MVVSRYVDSKWNLFAGIVMMMLGVFIWFNPFDIGVQEVIDIYITDDLLNGEWSDKLEVKNRIENSITEFSGNGDKLYVPVVENRQIKGYYKPDYSLGREKDFIEIKAYIKTNGAVRLYIDPSSSVIPVDSEEKKGDIAGAVRVAILMENLIFGFLILPMNMM